MQRRDITAIATTINDRRRAYRETPVYDARGRDIAVVAVDTVARDIAATLKREHPSFKADLFLKACGQ